jgi:hypothetical protein
MVATAYVFRVELVAVIAVALIDGSAFPIPTTIVTKGAIRGTTEKVFTIKACATAATPAAIKA